MFGIFGADGRRAKAARRASDPWPTTRRCSLSRVTLPPTLPLAIDPETTGLDPAKDTMLSVGSVPVDGDTIVLSGARTWCCRPTAWSGRAPSTTGLPTT